MQIWDLATGLKVQHLKKGPTSVHERPTSFAFSPDGRTLASGRFDGTVQVWDVATGKSVRHFEGHQARVFCLTFSPDGMNLASGSEDGTGLVWDLSGGRFRAGVPTPQELESLWTGLRSTDATMAYQAMWTLAGSPQAATSFLNSKVQHLSSDSAQQSLRIRRWITELDNDLFSIRQKAADELERLGTLAEPALRSALLNHPSTEARRRMEGILVGLQERTLPPETLRGIRAIGVLEQIGTPEAKAVLQNLATGAPEARLTQEAIVSLERLAKRP
jgi:hypothetical protein